jgi:hypothetical protein
MLRFLAEILANAILSQPVPICRLSTRSLHQQHGLERELSGGHPAAL